MIHRLHAICFALLFTCLARAQPPVLFFTDLTSGPNKGGEGNNGAIVTIYGNFFGSSQGSSTATIGGAPMVNCTEWGKTWLTLPSGQPWVQKISCQLGRNASTGDIVVTVGGMKSNPLPFTVRSGDIYFVAPNGHDGSRGDFKSPWETIPHAVQIAGAKPGSIVYAMDGVKAETEDGQGWNAALTLRRNWCAGTASAPTALVAYPGAAVTIGSSTSKTPAFGIRGTDASGGACPGNWIFAGVRFRGVAPVQSAGPSDNWRWVANDISNPAASGGGGGGGAWATQQSTHTKFLGNWVHDINLSSRDRLQQGVYLGTDSNHSEIAWNLIERAGGRTGLQVHSSPLHKGNGFAMYDILIHDNVMRHIAEECMIVDTVDPSKGPVRVYNNILFDCEVDGNGAAAIYRAESSDFDLANGAGEGNAEIFNNTIVLPFLGPGIRTWFEVHRGQMLVDLIRNNLIYAAPTAAYWEAWKSGEGGDWRACTNADTPTTCPNLAGSNNLAYGAGPPTLEPILGASINQDPSFANLSGGDFHPQPGSPAIGAALPVPGLVYDIEGKLRPRMPSIGALEPR